MKKLLSAVLLLLLVVSFTFITPSINAMQIPEGAIIKTEHNPDVYIVKYKNGKQFKRLVLNPQVFESYGHLRWEDILTVSQSEMNSFTKSTLVRSDGESNVYKLVANGDLGNKALVETGYTYDSDSVYTINNIDSENYVLKKLEELAGIIDELQKQIDDIKTEISTPKVDFCNNIEGDQTYIPVGMYRNNGNCFAEIVIPEPEPTSQVDFCNNIEGLQTCTPDGMYRDNGNCFTDIITPEPEPEPEHIPTTLSFKFDSYQSQPSISITNNGPEIVRIKSLNFTYFTPTGLNVIIDKFGNKYNGLLGQSSYKENWATDKVYYNTLNCTERFSIGTFGKNHDNSPYDPCTRVNNYSYGWYYPTQEDNLYHYSLGVNDIGVDESMLISYSDYTNYTVNYDNGILIDKGLQALKYVPGSIIEVSTGNDVLFEDFNL